MVLGVARPELVKCCNVLGCHVFPRGKPGYGRSRSMRRRDVPSPAACGGLLVKYTALRSYPVWDAEISMDEMDVAFYVPCL